MVAVDTHWQANWGQGGRSDLLQWSTLSEEASPPIHPLAHCSGQDQVITDFSHCCFAKYMLFSSSFLKFSCLDLISHENDDDDDDDVGEPTGVTLGADCSLDPCCSILLVRILLMHR